MQEAEPQQPLGCELSGRGFLNRTHFSKQYPIHFPLLFRSIQGPEPIAECASKLLGAFPDTKISSIISRPGRVAHLHVKVTSLELFKHLI